jgi:hypothetical protein
VQDFAKFIICAETPDPLQAGAMIPIAIEQDNLTRGA